MALSFKQSLAYFWEQIGKQFLKNGKEVEYEVLLPKTVLESNNDGFVIPDTIGIPVGGQAYTVVYNGETYYCTAQNGIPMNGGHACVIGDASQLNVEGVPAGDKGMPFLIVLGIDDNSNTITESIFQAWDNAASVTLEILVDAGESHLVKGFNGELKWEEKDYYSKGESIKTLMPQNAPKEYSSDSGGSVLDTIAFAYPWAEDLKGGEQYIVHFEGTDYEVTAVEVPEDNFIGHPGLIIIGGQFYGFEGVNPEVPFDILCIPNALFGSIGASAIAYVGSGADTKTIAIYKKYENVKKLDPKYIHTPDWNATEKEPGYIANKTHGYEFSEQAKLVELYTTDSEAKIYSLISKPLGLIEGQEYTVIIDGISYKTTGYALQNGSITVVCIGDATGMDDWNNASMPFFIVDFPMLIEGMHWMPQFQSLNKSFILMGPGKIVKKLDSEFIDWPDWYPATTIANASELANINVNLTYNEASLFPYSTAEFNLNNVEWVEGDYYTIIADGKEFRGLCRFQPNNIDSANTFYINASPLSLYYDHGIEYVDGEAVFIVDNRAVSTTGAGHYYRGIFSTFNFTNLIITKHEQYIKQLPFSAVEGIPSSLTNGKGLNSLMTRGTSCHANGESSVALGQRGDAVGESSFSFSSYSAGNGPSSTVTRYTGASGRGSISFAGGAAGGENSFAYGPTIADSTNQFTLGAHNIPDAANKYALIVGNGDGNANSANYQRNAFTINWDGNVWGKELYMGGTSDAEGASKVATETFVNNKLTNILTKSDLIYTTNEDKNLFAGPSGAFNKNFDLGSYSFTWGPLALGQGYASTAIGSSATVYESDFSTAIGYKATVYDGADYSVAIGSEAAVSYNADHSFAIGHGTAANSSEQIALGKYNRPLTGYSLMLGNGSGAATASRSNAFAVTTAGTGYFAGDLYVNGNGATNAFTGAKKVATESYVDTKVAGLVDSAPGTLDTLNELAAALGDDPNFATTVATEIGKKADKTDLVALTEAEILEVCGVAAVAHVSEVTW